MLKQAVGCDWKCSVSLVFYLVAIAAALRSSRTADAVFVAVALFWLIPGRRIEKRLAMQRS